MQISATNNYSLSSNRTQQNPNFGKLIVHDSFSPRSARVLVKNEEVQKLAKMFHDAGKNLEVKYRKEYVDPIVFYASPRGLFQTSEEPKLITYVGFTEDLKEGFAEKVFNSYKQLLKYDETNKIYSFNKSLEKSEAKKQSFWKRLFGKKLLI